MSDILQTSYLQAPVPLIDIGVNLTSDRFKDQHDIIIEESLQAGVETLIVTGTSLAESEAACELASRYPEQLYFTAGVHPHDASQWHSDTASGLAALLQDPRCVASGETGLDFNRNFSSPTDQEKAFEAQLELAIEHQKPLFMHERDAFDRQFQILKHYRDAIADGVIHCFTGSRKALFGYLDLDLHIGITGWVCDERRGTDLQALLPSIPQDRLMIETDAPYLLPRNMVKKPKDRTNRPAYLPWVLQMISRQLNIPEKELAQITRENSQRFFRLPDTLSSNLSDDEANHDPVSDFYRL